MSSSNKTQLFVALEGTDGAGKTRIRKHLFCSLREQGTDILSIVGSGWRDPEASDTIVKAKYRRHDVPRDIISAAYVRDKEVLSQRIIVPQLAARHVLSDRFIVSDLVYHSQLWGIDPLETYQRYVKSSVRWPDLTVFLDTPPETAFERKRARGTGGWHKWDGLDEQRSLYQLFLGVLFDVRLQRLSPVIRINNAESFENTIEQLEGSVIPILTGARDLEILRE